jgi:hypothetical protein
MKLSLKGTMEILAEITDMPWYEDVMDIPFTITEVMDIAGPVVELRVRGDEITDQDMRVIKTVFGPLTFTNDYGTTNGHGVLATHYILDMPPITVKVKIAGALTCTPDVAADSGATGEQVEKLIQQFEAGEIKLQTCTSMKHVDPKMICTSRECRGQAMREGLCYECFNNAQHELRQREHIDAASKLT